jgi:hypothetical protein
MNELCILYFYIISISIYYARYKNCKCFGILTVYDKNKRKNAGSKSLKRFNQFYKTLSTNL